MKHTHIHTHTQTQSKREFGTTTWRDWEGGSSTMSVLSLSPDCVYERETARVQWSSSLVYPSALHPHGQRRVAELMGLGGPFFSWEHGVQTENEVTHSKGKRRCSLDWHTNIQARSPIDNLMEFVRHRNHSGGLRCRAKKTKTSSRGEHALLSPQPRFLFLLLWVCLTTSSCCWQRGQGSVRSSDSQNRLQ